MFMVRRWRCLRRNVVLTCCVVLLFSIGYLWNYTNVVTGRGLLARIPMYREMLSFGNKDLSLSDVVKLLPRDPALVKYVHSRLLVPPSNEEYNLTSENTKDFSRGQSRIVDAVAGERTEGFFVECGAHNGESASVSLFLERERGWGGLLVEPDPQRFRSLRSKHRKAFLLNACARANSTDSQSMKRTAKEQLFYDDTSSVPCLWLSTILLATGRWQIDLLALNVKGREFSLLRTVPWKEFSILTVSVELTEYDDDTEYLAMNDYMRSQGYSMQHQFINHIVQKKDVIYAISDSPFTDRK